MSTNPNTEPSATLDHAALINRDMPNQHPQAAIDNLETDLRDLRNDIAVLDNDLVTGLADKAAIDHPHTMADVAGLDSTLAMLQTDVDAKADDAAVQQALAAKADAAHSHAGLESALADKAPLVAGVFDATVTKSGTVFHFAVAGLPTPLPRFVTMRGVVPADYAEGDGAAVNGTPTALLTPTMAALLDGSWKTGALVELIWDTAEGRAFFKPGAGCCVDPGVCCRDGWNISVGGETPVPNGIHIPDAVTPTGVVVDNEFRLIAGLVKQVACGNNVTLILLHTGEVLSCGTNRYGQLGRAVATGTATSVNLGLIPGLRDVASVSAGKNHSLFVMNDGSVKSCGHNSTGELGRIVATGSESSVNLGTIPDVSGVVAATAGTSCSFFILNNGKVAACGSNGGGQLGRTGSSGNPSLVNLALIPNLQGVVSIASYNASSLFLMNDGTVRSCGNNNDGQLGRLSTTLYDPETIPNLNGVVAIAAAFNHSLFLLRDGTVMSCGNNARGQLGRAVAKGSATSVNLGVIPGLTDVIGIAAGHQSSLFLLRDGTMKACGDLTTGRFGLKRAYGSPTKVNLGPANDIIGASAISVYHDHSIFVFPDGTVMTFGDMNLFGQLGRTGQTHGSGLDDIGKVDLSRWDPGLPAPLPYPDGTILIQQGGLDAPSRVALYKDCHYTFAVSPLRVYQVENGVAVEKTFELRQS